MHSLVKDCKFSDKFPEESRRIRSQSWSHSREGQATFKEHHDMFKHIM